MNNVGTSETVACELYRRSVLLWRAAICKAKVQVRLKASPLAISDSSQSQHSRKSVTTPTPISGSPSIQVQTFIPTSPTTLIEQWLVYAVFIHFLL